MELKLAENIRTFRKTRGLTQEQLAEALMVSVGAVSKWEKGASIPDISLILEMADFFETSVDVLLGYEWHKRSMGQTAERIRALRQAKDFTEGVRLAEQALQKYPNSFEIVYQSAELYFVMLTEAAARRALALFQRACELIDQNSDPEIGLVSLQNQMAECYLVLGQYDGAVALLKQNNFDGHNDGLIGYTLAVNCRKAEEALPYLSKALVHCQSELFHICVGYANAFGMQKQPEQAKQILLWLLHEQDGLKQPGMVTYMDKSSAILWVMCAELALGQGDADGARYYLKQAKKLAERFDAAPEYGMKHLKYYHGEETATAYDNLGRSAMEGIVHKLQEDEAGQALLPIWKELTNET